jgi:hypothetical protein
LKKCMKNFHNLKQKQDKIRIDCLQIPNQTKQFEFNLRNL